HVTYAQVGSSAGGLISDIINGPQETATTAVTSSSQEQITSIIAPTTTTKAAATTTAFVTTLTDAPYITTEVEQTRTRTRTQAVQTLTDDSGTTTRGHRTQVRVTTTLYDSTDTDISKTSSSTASATSNPTNAAAENNDTPNKTGIVAGSVVGCLVAVALIGGILTWMNRRGGCTSRTRRRDKSSNDFEGEANDYKMTEDHVGDNMHASNSPFQHARRFVPPTSGYMNLNDEEHAYHQEMNKPNYQYAPEYNSNTVGSQNPQAEYYQQGYYNAGQPPSEYSSPNAYEQPYYNTATGPNLTSPNVTNPVVGSNYQQMKPDQIEQKPNAA
ncbi:hypothetical protein A0J61_09190, partial [Choanephora cucurbitarum]